MTDITIRNRLLENESIQSAIVEIDPPPLIGSAQISGSTDRIGRARLDTARLSNGPHTLRVTPAHMSTSPVGPATASNPVPPDRIYRPLEFQITLINGIVSAVRIAADNKNGSARLISSGNILIHLQPVWIRSPNHGTRGSDPTLIIIHHTGSRTITSVINTFLNSDVSAHYTIDKDGQIVKMVSDKRRANHAGRARWGGSSQINSSSIGIEIVHRQQDGSYLEAQYTSLLGLLSLVRTAFPSIPVRNIVGHSDVAVNAAGRLGRKSTDPGMHFDWRRLEALGLGLVPVAGPFPSSIYGGLFDLDLNAAFRRGDRDNTRRFGGSNRPNVTGDPVREIQQDLTSLGYSLGTPDGVYGELSEYAVRMVQEHFFAGGRISATPNGRVDFSTASLIKSVL